MSALVKSQPSFSNWFDRAVNAYDAANDPTYLDKDGQLIEGIYLGMPNDVYHALDAYSSSQLKSFFESPAKYHRDYISDETRARTLQTKRTLDTGTLAHELCLEPDGFFDRYFRDLLPIEFPNAIHTVEQLNTALEEVGLSARESKSDKLARLNRLVSATVAKEFSSVKEIDDALVSYGFNKTETKLDKAHRLLAANPRAQVFDLLFDANRRKHGQEAQTLNEHGDTISLYGGKRPIDGLVWDDAHRAYRTVIEHVEASGHLSYGMPEVAIIARCPTTGLMLKCKFDWLRFDDDAVDVKTSLSASPYKFRQKLFDLHYDLQQAFYMYVAGLAGITIGTFTFVAVEFSNLNACQPYQLGESKCKKAKLQLADTLIDFKWCLDNNVWYGYQREDCTIILD